MRISAERLTAVAEATGFRPDLLEKVARLLGLLETLQSHPFLKGKLALKGGTALNLFVFQVPRLSVDMDLNFVGAESKEAMLEARPKIEQAIQAVFSREKFLIRRMPEEHAGGKWLLRYESTYGMGGNLEMDLNYMYRVPLWSLVIKNSKAVGPWQASDIPLLDHHELAAGKLAALLSRRQARDVFDCQRILELEDLDHGRLRIAFVVYGAMNRRDWRTVSKSDVDFDLQELTRQLIPTLRSKSDKQNEDSASSTRKLLEECRNALSAVLPLKNSETEFLNQILDRGIIDPTLLTTDDMLQHRIMKQPLLEWKAANVRKHRGLS